jgi:hypothetical protein
MDDLLRVVRLEFEEMPGLALTADQARRLWALDAGLCSRVLHRLVDAGYLDVDDGGQYVRPTTA